MSNLKFSRMDEEYGDTPTISSPIINNNNKLNKGTINEILTNAPESEDSHSKKGLTASLCFTVFAIVLSSFQFGYAVGVVNPPENIVRDWYNETQIHRKGTAMSLPVNTFLWAITVSCYGISGLFGALISGSLSHKYGQKLCLLLNNIPSLLAAICVMLAKPMGSYEMVILSRLLTGLNCGITSGIVSTYLADISPHNLRGLTGASHQLAMTVSTLTSQLLGLPFLFGNYTLWPYLFAIGAIPAIIQLMILPYLPGSPRHTLIYKNNENLAKIQLHKLRHDERMETKELMDLKREKVENQSLPHMNWHMFFTTPAYFKPIMLCLVAQIGQQLTGIGAILAFSTSIFLSTGFTTLSAVYATCGISAVLVLVTLISMLLIEKLGRRTLFLMGLMGLFVFNTLLTICLTLGANNRYPVALYAAIAMIIGFVCSFSIGPGVIAWFIASELFDVSARPKGTSFAMAINWITNFITVLIFPLLVEVMGNRAFLVYAMIALLSWLYLYLYLPETRGRSPEDIAKFFAGQSIKKTNAEAKTDAPYATSELLNT